MVVVARRCRGILMRADVEVLMIDDPAADQMLVTEQHLRHSHGKQPTETEQHSHRQDNLTEAVSRVAAPAWNRW